MKSKTTKVRRYLAAILTVLMIFQQATTSVIYASSEAAVPTVTEAPAAQTEETPEKQVEETPEEVVEETQSEMPEPEQTTESSEEPEESVEEEPETQEESEVVPEPEEPGNGIEMQNVDEEANGVMALSAEANSSEYVYSNDLNQFITNVNFSESSSGNSVEDGNGNITLKKNREYTLDLSFAEQENAGGYQFRNPLTYDLKSKLGNDFDYVNAGGTVDIIVTDTNTNQKVTVTGNYNFSADGKLVVNLPDNDTLNRAGDAQFSVKLNVKTTETITGKNITFKAGIVKNIQIDNQSKIRVNKEITKYDEDGTAHYKVTVKSEGINTNVHVIDTISGDILQYKKDVKTTPDNIIYAENGGLTHKENGFECTILRMNDNEEVTFEYSASIDWSKVPNGQVSIDKKKNKVSVKSTEDSNGEQKDVEYGNSDHTISYNWVKKKGILNKEGDKITWTFTVNEDQKVSAGGKKVTDTIDENSRQYISYESGGVVILDIYGEDGSLIKSDNLILGRDLTLTENYKWSYTIPATDAKCKYIFKYDTVVSKQGLINNTNVKNTGSVEGKGEVSSEVGIEGDSSSIEKRAVSVSSSEVSWEVKVKVPGKNVNSLVLTETLPWKWVNEIARYDKLKDNHIVFSCSTNEALYWKMSPEDASDSKEFKITFYKDAGCTQEGLDDSTQSQREIIT